MKSVKLAKSKSCEDEEHQNPSWGVLDASAFDCRMGELRNNAENLQRSVLRYVLDVKEIVMTSDIDIDDGFWNPFRKILAYWKWFQIA